MGAKTSKSANITASPKKEKEPIATEGENHVNGDAGTKDEIIKDANNAVTEVIEVCSVSRPKSNNFGSPYFPLSSVTSSGYNISFIYC